MSDPTGGDPFANIPLFRELQKVLFSSSGPVNWELARQVGMASTVSGEPDPQPSEQDRLGLEQTVQATELQIAGFTGLDLPRDPAEVRAVRRQEWVEANIEGLAALLEPAAEKAGEALAKAQQEGLPEEMKEALAQRQPDGGMGMGIEQLLGRMSPLLVGAQIGSVMGYLAQRVLGQYDVAVPRERSGALLFVLPNIARFEQEWSLPPMEFRAFVALHEVTHRFEFAPSWVRDHFVGLVRDFTSTLQLDVSGMMERLERIDPSDPTAMQDLFSGEEMFGAVMDDEQRLKLNRVQAFMAAAEGYGDHVTHRLGRQMLGSYRQIDEAFHRHREDEASDPVFERLLGIEMKREQYELGRTFCDTVADQTDEATLGRMWSDPEALPSKPELEEPTLWLSRTV
jgi:putative hydrolase